MTNFVLRVTVPCLNCGHYIQLDFTPEDSGAYLFCPICRVRAYVANDPAGIVESLVYYRYWGDQEGQTVGPITLETVNPDTGAVVTSRTF